MIKQDARPIHGETCQMTESDVPPTAGTEDRRHQLAKAVLPWNRDEHPSSNVVYDFTLISQSQHLNRLVFIAE